jgi:hypothetical protein
LVEDNIAKLNKWFSESEFVKACMLAAAEAILPENRPTPENLNSLMLRDTAQLLMFIRGLNDKVCVII